MQTFLPLPNFAESARCLDRQRLGKQRVEILQILNTLMNNGGWRNHPAVKMWKGHESALIDYGLAICNEWHDVRGYKDTCAGKIFAYYRPAMPTSLPHWLGDEVFHLAHKSNLIRKLPQHYGKLWPDVPADLPYVWPTVKQPAVT